MKSFRVEPINDRGTYAMRVKIVCDCGGELGFDVELQSEQTARCRCGRTYAVHTDGRSTWAEDTSRYMIDSVPHCSGGTFVFLEPIPHLQGEEPRFELISAYGLGEIREHNGAGMLYKLNSDRGYHPVMARIVEPKISVDPADLSDL